jgi:type III secretion protein O
MFDEMLSIKRFREKQAELALLRQRQRRSIAIVKADETRVRLEKYRDWAQKKEKAMYSSLCSQIVRPRDIESVLAEVAELRVSEGHYVSAVNLADEELKQEAHALDERRVEHEYTVRMTRKFTEIAEVYWESMAQEAMKVEDNELEEIAGISKESFFSAFDESEFI